MSINLACEVSSPRHSRRANRPASSLPPLSMFSPRRTAKSWKIHGISEETTPDGQSSPKPTKNESSLPPKTPSRTIPQAPYLSPRRGLTRANSELISPRSKTIPRTPHLSPPRRVLRRSNSFNSDSSPSRSSPTHGLTRQASINTREFLTTPSKKFSCLEDVFAEYEKITVDEI